MNPRSIRFRLTVWYAGLLAALLALFGVFVFVALNHFLETTLRESLATESKTIGEALLLDVGKTGEEYVVKEMEEHFAPRITGRFLRVTRADGSVLYQSDAPPDKSFDPSEVPPGTPAGDAGWQEQRLANGASLLIYSLPFRDRSGKPYLIQAGVPHEQVNRVLQQLLVSFAIAFPLILGAATAGGYFLMKRSLRPLDEIASAAERITSRNLDERLPKPATGDELEKVAASLNRMMARLEESFHHINRFSADASHEIRTPLAIIRGELENAYQASGLTPELRETLGSALEEVDRLSRIAEQLLEISRLESGESLIGRSAFDLVEVAKSTVDQMKVLAEEKSLRLRFEGSSPLHVEANQLRVQQVVVNLVDNAIKYTPPGGSVRVSSSSAEGKAILEVVDTGIGVPETAAPHIFERFYRVDSARSRQLGGAGLGLAIVKSICLAYGGSVTLISSEGHGSTFRVELPLL